jgi:hypothetical protein
MYDLWYSLGAAVMFPQIIDEVKTKGDAAGVAAGRPAGASLFFPVQNIQFYDAVNKVPIKNPNIADPVGSVTPVINDSGFVVAEIIDDIRSILKNSIHNWFPFAPPISLYTAGKFCQFMTVPDYNLTANLSLANQGYQAAVKSLPAKRSPNFPAFLGVLLIDPGLSGSLLGNTAPPLIAQNALSEFQVTDPGEIGAFQSLVQPGAFMNAHDSLLGSLNPASWTTCKEQFLAWSPRTDGMVI